MASVRAPALRPSRVEIVPERLESCIRRLDPADRALLDLSLNRRIPDWSMAPILRTDPMRLAWKRARAIERVASRMGLTDPAALAEVRMALIALPDRAWLPLELQPAPVPKVLEPPEPAGAEPRVHRRARGAPMPPAQGEIVVRYSPTATASNKGTAHYRQRHAKRGASSLIGGLSERAKRAYPRETMTTHAKRAVGALAVGAVAVALRRR